MTTIDDLDPRVPVTVLTGFLGAGKTTLLNQILRENHGRRIAVIENEFGEIGIDHELVVGADEEVFEMSNGCICCTVRGDLIRVIGNLMRRRDRFDHILVETTGLADPGPVAQTFFVDAEIAERTRLDAIALVSEHLCSEFDLQVLVDGQPVSPERARTYRANHEHDPAVGSVGLAHPGPLDGDLLGAWLRTLLNERGTDIFRTKGVLALDGDARRWTVQAVHMLLRAEPQRPWGDEPRSSRLVFIGRHLDRAALEIGFRACAR